MQQRPIQQRQQPQQLQQRPHVARPVYALNHEETKAADNVVELKLTVFDHEARALFNSGSTHSFIAPHFAIVIGVDPEQLKVALAVTTVVGRKVVCVRRFTHGVEFG